MFTSIDINQKQCKKCLEIKSKHLFPKNDVRGQYKTICKSCISIYNKEYRNKNKDYFSNYYQTNKERINPQIYQWARDNSIKRKAHLKIRHLVKVGKLKKEPCMVCGTIMVEAHHDNYLKPLEIVWLCKTHHAEIKLNYSHDYGLYKRIIPYKD